MSELKPGWLRRQIEVTVAKRKFMDGAEAIFNEQVLPIIADPLPKDGEADELAAVVSDLHKVQGELDVAEASAARLRKAVEDAKTVLKAVRVDMSLTPDDRRRKVDGVIDTLTAALQPETGTGAKQYYHEGNWYDERTGPRSEWRYTNDRPSGTWRDKPAQPTRGDDPDPVTPGKDEQSPP